MEKGGRFVGYFVYILCGYRETRSPDLYYEPLRPVYPDCNTFATPNGFKQKTTSPISGRLLRISATDLDLGPFALFSRKISFFCGLDRTRTCDLADVNGAF
jgi:hypothetical protein